MKNESPSLIQVCRRLLELWEGGVTLDALIVGTGWQSRYVRDLIRFYRALPEEVRQRIGDDEERRITFRVLHAFALLAKHDSALLEIEVERVLSGSPPHALRDEVWARTRPS